MGTVCCNILNFVRSILSLLALGFISYGTYYIVNKNDEISCSNFNLGFIFGIVSYALILIGILVKVKVSGFRPILALGAVCLFSTLGYCSYIYFSISSECKDLMSDSTFNAFEYYLISLLITSAFMVFYYVIQYTIKRSRIDENGY